MSHRPRRVLRPHSSHTRIKTIQEEGYEPTEAVSTTIKAMGIKEYAEEIGMDSGNLYKHLNNRGNLTLKTIKRILKPLGLGPGIVTSNETNKTV